MRQQELSNRDINCSNSDVGDQKDSILLVGYLLTAAKVFLSDFFSSMYHLDTIILKCLGS